MPGQRLRPAAVLWSQSARRLRSGVSAAIPAAPAHAAGRAELIARFILYIRSTVTESCGARGRGFQLDALPFAPILNHMVKYQDETLDRTFAALSDPTRRALLARLGQDSLSVSE